PSPPECPHARGPRPAPRCVAPAPTGSCAAPAPARHCGLLRPASRPGRSRSRWRRRPGRGPATSGRRRRGRRRPQERVLVALDWPKRSALPYPAPTEEELRDSEHRTPNHESTTLLAWKSTTCSRARTSAVAASIGGILLFHMTSLLRLGDPTKFQLEMGAHASISTLSTPEPILE